MDYKNFTSLPPEQEQSFVIFERTSVEAGKKAMTIGAICGAVFGVFIVMLVMSFDAPENKHAVKKPSAKVGEAKAKPAAAPAPAPVEAAPAEAAPAETAPAEAAAPTEAPAPPAGATKAPPTALTGE